MTRLPLLQRAFTLIEVMIVVAIVAILAAIAIPSYRDYILRGNITDAVTALGSMQASMEQHFQDNKTYAGACAAGTIAPLPPNTNKFTFTCPVLAATTYTVAAAGTGSMTGFGYNLALGAGGVVTKSTTALPTGWTTPAPNTCWALKKDGSC
ncbi:MAG: prepilin-type N-terminal cleavage/methylation domain-containing protein [Rhizobacter sp.]